VLCVLRSGGGYDAEWVRKLRDGCARQIQRKHRFVCLSDVDVPCERIPLQHDWPGWWAKIEMFREGVIEGETLYLDLDTVLVGKVEIIRNGVDFAMLQSFWPDGVIGSGSQVGSGVMWFSGDNVPHNVYSKFARQPKAYMAHYERNRSGTYVGDQGFLWDCLGPDIAKINDYIPGIKSYKMHCKRMLPQDASIVCFHGVPKLTDVDAPWIKEHWC